jgi:hypothetical protein
MTVAERVAAPSPRIEKRMLATTTVGTVRRLGSQESRHCGIRRNAKARMIGAISVAPAVNPDSILWADECQESF